MPSKLFGCLLIEGLRCFYAIVDLNVLAVLAAQHLARILNFLLLCRLVRITERFLTLLELVVVVLVLTHFEKCLFVLEFTADLLSNY